MIFFDILRSNHVLMNIMQQINKKTTALFGHIPQCVSIDQYCTLFLYLSPQMQAIICNEKTAIKKGPGYFVCNVLFHAAKKVFFKFSFFSKM